MTRFLTALALGLAVAGSAHAQMPSRFKAHLDGFDLNGNPIATNATGEATIEIIDGGTALAFKVNIAGIDNLLMAHIHISPVPVEITDPTGPIAFWFTGGPPPRDTVTETTNGTLAAGFVVTDGQLSSWDAGDPQDGTVAGLIAAIEQGRATVVVHTDDLNPDTPGGTAGDSRAGEIRGTFH